VCRRCGQVLILLPVCWFPNQLVWKPASQALANLSDTCPAYPLPWVAERLHPGLDGIDRVHGRMLCDARSSTSHHMLQQHGTRGVYADGETLYRCSRHVGRAGLLTERNTGLE
jgi:hypothetical protein